MFGQIKMEIPWYINRHTLISRKRDGKPRMIGGQFVVVCVGVHQLSVSPNTSHPMLQICSKLLHGNSMPSLNSSYIQRNYRLLNLVAIEAKWLDIDRGNKKRDRQGKRLILVLRNVYQMLPITNFYKDYR